MDMREPKYDCEILKYDGPNIPVETRMQHPKYNCETRMLYLKYDCETGMYCPNSSFAEGLF